MSEMTTAAGAQGAPTFELRHRMARALEVAGLTNDEMAEVLGVSGATVRNYVAGRTNPRDGWLRLWALRCGVPYEWLKTGEVASTGPITPGGQGITGTGCDAESAGQVVRLDDWRSADLSELEAVA